MANISKPQALLVEDAASGQQLIQQLRRENKPGIPRPIACRPEGSKLLRFLNQTPQTEAGEVVLPEDALWLAPFEKEVVGFPGGKLDDQADALAPLLGWSGNRREKSIPVGPQLLTLDGTPHPAGEDEDDSWWDSEGRYVARG